MVQELLTVIGVEEHQCLREQSALLERLEHLEEGVELVGDRLYIGEVVDAAYSLAIVAEVSRSRGDGGLTRGPRKCQRP
jgi:hypothetical protein